MGRTAREIMGDIPEACIDLARVVDTREDLAFEGRLAETNRWCEAKASALGPDLFVVVFFEVDDRIRVRQALAASDARKNALLELSEKLRAARTAEAMSYVASEIMGETLSASRAGHISIDALHNQATVLVEWCASDVACIAESFAFSNTGYMPDLNKGRLVVISDTANDLRLTGDRRSRLERHGIQALVNAPVIENSVLVSVTFVHFSIPRVLNAEEQAFVRMVADRTQVGIARLRADERQATLNSEINHRLKNILAMAQAVASQTLKGRVEPQAMRELNERLVALGKAQDVLMQTNCESADLSTIISEVLSVAGACGRFHAIGPVVQLSSQAVLSLSLLLHELGTNAQKYGALSRPDGRILIHWRLESADGGMELILEWREEGGPPANAPTREGFGSQLLRMGLARAGTSNLDFGAEGLSAVFRAPFSQISAMGVSKGEEVLGAGC